MRWQAAAVLGVLLATTFSATAREYRVYFLGGQSNMEGYGKVQDLPADLQQVQENVWIFHGNTALDDQPGGGAGIWAPLQPGHGAGFAFQEGRNLYSERFGIELSFAKRLQELQPAEGIALIKYARGGSSIAIAAARQFGCWDADYRDRTAVNQYDHFLATVRQAFAIRDIDGDGQEDTLVPAGIVWMQGESDADVDREVAFAYRDNLKRLMDLIRAALRVDDLPVVIGRISDSGRDTDGRVWNYGEIVRHVQAEFVERDPAAALVTETDTYGYSDKWHYDSAGFIDLGKRFAEAVFRLH